MSNAGVDCSYYDKFEPLLEKWLPERGEGESLASQAVTAVNKIVYKWYNDGDIYDNTHDFNYGLSCNDISKYANWLSEYIPETRDILQRIKKIPFDCDEEYELLLKDLADLILSEEFLQKINGKKQGSVYNCEGDFRYEEPQDEEDDDYDEDDYEEDDYEEDDEDQEYYL